MLRQLTGRPPLELFEVRRSHFSVYEWGCDNCGHIFFYQTKGQINMAFPEFCPKCGARHNKKKIGRQNDNSR
jgi:predicted nucleic-acid-binding Zn-ribbon protein